jgi:hypothetical protein
MINCKKVKYSGLNDSYWTSQEDKKIRKNSQARKFSEISVTITCKNVKDDISSLQDLISSKLLKIDSG